VFGDIVALFQDNIRDLRPSGSAGQYMGLCPLHHDEHPSFSVNLDNGLCQCFGCGFKGDAANFAERLGIPPGPYYRGENGSPPPSTALADQSQKDIPLPEAVVEQARNWYVRLQNDWERLSKDLPWTKEAAKRAGVGYDADADRMVFMHRDSQGRVVNLKHHKGRGSLPPYSIKGHGQNRLYPGHLLPKYDEDFVIYCEGEKDAVTLLSQGYNAVTGTAGAENVPPDLRPLSKFKAVVVILDNDDSGHAGTVKVADSILAQCPNTEACISYWPEDKPSGYDITDFFQDGGTAEDFQRLMLKDLDLYQPVRPEPQFQTKDFHQFSPRLDIERLTPALREFLRQAAPATDAPDEFLILAYLTHWAGVVGNKILGPDRLRPNIWAVIFAGSSEVRKSTALSLAGRSFKVVQMRFDAGLKDEWGEYKADHLRWKSLTKKQQAEIPEPEKPIANNMLLPIDFSDAGFYMALKQNPVSGVIVASEFADFHKKLNRDYTAQADAFLSAYDNDRMSRQTRQHELEVIEEPTFSILGATTFENFRRVFQPSEMETGFFQRIFPVAVPSPTKPRKLFLQRSEMEGDFIRGEAAHIKAWLDCPGDLEVVIPQDTREAFNAWEMIFVTGARAKYGERIGPHIERMVPGCLKLAMLCEALEMNDPAGLKQLTLSIKSLLCAQMLVENLFLPSVNYLLEEEIVYGKERLNEKKVERVLKAAGGTMDRTALIRETRLSSKELDEAIHTLQDKACLEISSEHQERKQAGGNPRIIYTWIGE